MASHIQWRHQEFWFGGYSPGGFGERKSPSGVQGRSPHKKCGDKVPQKLKQFADIVYRFWLQKPSKIECFTQFVRPVCFTVGAERSFGLGGLSFPPSPCQSSPLRISKPYHQQDAAYNNNTMTFDRCAATPGSRPHPRVYLFTVGRSQL